PLLVDLKSWIDQGWFPIRPATLRLEMATLAVHTVPSVAKAVEGSQSSQKFGCMGNSLRFQVAPPSLEWKTRCRPDPPRLFDPPTMTCGWLGSMTICVSMFFSLTLLSPNSPVTRPAGPVGPGPAGLRSGCASIQPRSAPA